MGWRGRWREGGKGRWMEGERGMEEGRGKEEWREGGGREGAAAAPDGGGEKLPGEDVGAVEGGGQGALPHRRQRHAGRAQLCGERPSAPTRTAPPSGRNAALHPVSTTLRPPAAATPHCPPSAPTAPPQHPTAPLSGRNAALHPISTHCAPQRPKSHTEPRQHPTAPPQHPPPTAPPSGHNAALHPISTHCPPSTPPTPQPPPPGGRNIPAWFLSPKRPFLGQVLHQLYLLWAGHGPAGLRGGHLPESAHLCCCGHPG